MLLHKIKSNFESSYVSNFDKHSHRKIEICHNINFYSSNYIILNKKTAPSCLTKLLIGYSTFPIFSSFTYFNRLLNQFLFLNFLKVLFYLKNQKLKIKLKNTKISSIGNFKILLLI